MRSTPLAHIRKMNHIRPHETISKPWSHVFFWEFSQVLVARVAAILDIFFLVINLLTV